MSVMHQQAGRQKGHLTRAQLRAWRVSDDQLYRLCKNEGWVEVLPRVYRLPGTPDTWENKLVAASLWLGERGHFFGQTAAYVLRLDGIAGLQRSRWLCIPALRPGALRAAGWCAKIDRRPGS